MSLNPVRRHTKARPTREGAGVIGQHRIAGMQLLHQFLHRRLADTVLKSYFPLQHRLQFSPDLHLARAAEQFPLD